MLIGQREKSSTVDADACVQLNGFSAESMLIGRKGKYKNLINKLG